MKQRFFVALLMMLLCLPLALAPVHAQDDDDEDENKPTQQQSEMYRRLTDTSVINPIELQNSMQALGRFPSRVVGYPGANAAADYVESEFHRLGLSDVRRESFSATVPIDEGASLTLGNRKFTLQCIWPNSVRTSTVPAAGLTGRLVYAGSGTVSELNGKDVKDSIILVDFNSGTEWLNSPRLGARAVIFLAPEKTIRGEAESKFLSVPLNLPRFWASRTDSPALIAASRSAAPP